MLTYRILKALGIALAEDYQPDEQVKFPVLIIGGDWTAWEALKQLGLKIMGTENNGRKMIQPNDRDE